MDKKERKDDPLQILTEAPEGIAHLLHSAAHPARVKVLTLLVSGDLQLNSLVESTALSKNALVNHLNLLIQAGLVSRAKRGVYRLTKDGREMLESASIVYSTSEWRKEVERAKLRTLYDSKYYRGVKMEKKTVSAPAEYRPCWLSFTGAMAGCLRSLGIDCDIVDVGGYSGYAFILNVSKGRTSPAGPTAFNNWEPIKKGTESLGIHLEHWFDDRSYPEKQGMPTPTEIERARKLFEKVKRSIDKDRPVVVWGLHLPEYGIVNGYDGSSYMVDTLYHHIGQKDEPIIYYDLKATGCMDAYFFGEGMEVDRNERARAALKRAIHYAKGDFKTVDGFVCGPKALTEWADVLSSGRQDIIDYFGHSYTSQCFAESKEMCTEFTKRLAKEGKGKWTEDLLMASEEYARASKLMTELASMFPFQGVKKNVSEEDGRKGAELLRETRRFEEAAIVHLERALRT
jgi:DNA-binding transcriptional ArsR family regulator